MKFESKAQARLKACYELGDLSKLDAVERERLIQAKTNELWNASEMERAKVEASDEEINDIMTNWGYGK